MGQIGSARVVIAAIAIATKQLRRRQAAGGREEEEL